ncbi:MAG: hypothetical protein NXI24_20865 [bacterium]|nr:hypothetical protein [bacterium]
MKKDQYILAISGILDAESADLLLREIGTLVRTGYHEITLNGRDLAPVLPDGVLALRRGILDLLAHLESSASGPEPDALRIDCVELSEHASAQFLLSAVPVANRRAVLAPPAEARETIAAENLEEYFGETSAGAPGDTDAANHRPSGVAALGAEGWLVDCLNCRHTSRVRAPGEYACPVCGSAFRMNPAGDVVAV